MNFPFTFPYDQSAFSPLDNDAQRAFPSHLDNEFLEVRLLQIEARRFTGLRDQRRRRGESVFCPRTHKLVYESGFQRLGRLTRTFYFNLTKTSPRSSLRLAGAFFVLWPRQEAVSLDLKQEKI